MLERHKSTVVKYISANDRLTQGYDCLMIH